MPILIHRLAAVPLMLLAACSAPQKRPSAPNETASSAAPSAIYSSDAKPQVVTVPIDTGLEPVSSNVKDPVVSPYALPPEVDLNRPADATSSPYPAPGESFNSQADQHAVEPLIEPVLPVIDYPTTPEPPPVRALSPRISEKLFVQAVPPAVSSLEVDIESHFKGHRYGDAAAQIDRALRIQPKNPELWHVLAEIRLRQNQPGLAVDLAKKSNSLAKSNIDLIKSNWRIIADARRQQGDGIGAQEALEKAW